MLEDQPVGAADPLLPPPRVGWTDVLTGTDGPRYWDRVVTSEQARIRRYRRPATICLVDIAGYDVFARRWGADVGQRLFVRIARALAGEVRSSDHIARIGPTRIAILLTETDEIAAINFVERARASCEAHLGVDSEGLRIGMGWASPPGKAGLSDAFGVADRPTGRGSRPDRLRGVGSDDRAGKGSRRLPKEPPRCCPGEGRPSETDASATRQGHLSRRLHRLP